ncbi:isocitrate lyase/phosphoenolpyruvate mutase family protein, partial [Salmonella enterica]|uniref:isocitrate lyase/phosphoenolpyruvate mutase family protein n=1 Tax=Salmonella enterica TaxID=28901 RepID=UPI003D7C1519
MISREITNLSDDRNHPIACCQSLSQPSGVHMRTQADKAARFRELHQRPGAFIIPNPWDAGTAKLLAAMGFEALATT